MGETAKKVWISGNGKSFGASPSSAAIADADRAVTSVRDSFGETGSMGVRNRVETAAPLALRVCCTCESLGDCDCGCGNGDSEETESEEGEEFRR